MWQAIYDEQSQEYYYWNTETQETTWEPPEVCDNDNDKHKNIDNDKQNDNDNDKQNDKNINRLNCN